MSAKLEGVEHAVDVGPQAGQLALSVRAPTLLGYIYAHVAQAIASKKPMRACRECGAIFVVDNARQQFCRPACSKRGRQRQWLQGTRDRRARDAQQRPPQDRTAPRKNKRRSPRSK